MAKVDYDPVPTVAPETQAPDDLQHISASPNAFGAAVGQGVEALGQGALDASKFYDRVSADDATNNTLQQATSILHGDPNKMVMGPDGTMVPDTGYFGKRGADAMSAREGVSQSLDEAIQEHRESLSTPMAKYQYDVDTRRYRAQWQAQIGEYADGQQKVWATDTNTTSATLGLNAAARAPMDETTVADAQNTVRKAYVRNAQLKGEDASGAVLKADQDVAVARIHSAIISNPAAAEKIFNDNAPILGSLANYDQLGRQVQEASFNSQLTPNIEKAVGTFTADAQRFVQGTAVAPSGEPKGAVYDQIGSFAAQDGASPAESSYLKRLAVLESSGNPNAQNGISTGLFQFHPDTFTKAGGVDIHDTGQQVSVALKTSRDNAQALTSAGVSPTGGNLYLMHQQGPAGGVALLTAPPGVSAIAALTPVYETHGRSAQQATEVATQAITRNGGAPDMTAGDFTALWQRKYGNAGGAASGGYPSVATALQANMGKNLDTLRTQAAQLFPDRPDYQERYVETGERRLNQTISIQHQQYDVDTDIVKTAMVGPGAPISEDQLRARGPQVSGAWDRLQAENPIVASHYQNVFTANSMGQAKGYGTLSHDYLDRVLAPQSDAQRIQNSGDLAAFVGAGEDAPLTNTGYAQLSNLITIRGTPQGEAFASQAKTFLDNAYGQLTFSNKGTGLRDPKGEALYSKFLAQALPQLEAANKNGTLGKVLDPKSPDYLGNVANTFARTPAQIVHDRLTDEGNGNILTGGQLGPQFALRQAVAEGRINRDEGVWIAQKMGWIGGDAAPPAGAPAAAPRAHVPGQPPHTHLVKSNDGTVDFIVPDGQ